MAVFEATRYRPVDVYANTSDDLKEVASDTVCGKIGHVLDTGKKYVLFPEGDTWYEDGGAGTVPAYTPPSPPDPPAPSTVGIVGTAVVGTSTVGSGE